MEIEFALNRKEYEEFVNAAYARIFRIGKSSSKMFVLNMVVWIFFGVGFAGLFHFYEQYCHLDLAHLNVALCSILIGVIGFLGTRVYLKKLFFKNSVHDNGRMLKPQKLQISEQGLKFQTNDCVQSYSWPSIQDFEESKNLYCFYLDNNQALLVPKRSVAEIGITEEFLNYANITKSSNN